MIPSASSTAFKAAMASCGSNTMILTSASSKGALLHGMTLSSVTSLTVHPEPVVQFNLQVPSATSRELHKSKYLALHILKSTDESVKLARIFSMGAKFISQQRRSEKVTTPFHHLNKDEWKFYKDYNFEGNNKLINHLNDENIDIPLLTQAERILICEKYKIFQVFNHEIWTCKVKDIIDKTQQVETKNCGGLIYFNRKFHKIGPHLNEPDHL
ncbi:hypothetical protein DAMA08_004930 [Martiniozyma asiatica (nom. inval.)]|nr:hypothetical protein DAMA08_004930 [Martiniozyma asiatica]